MNINYANEQFVLNTDGKTLNKKYTEYGKTRKSVGNNGIKHNFSMKDHMEN